MSLPLLHFGRAPEGTHVEDGCPCGQAPCGLVRSDQTSPDCDVHGPKARVDLRQHHRPGMCPALPGVRS